MFAYLKEKLVSVFQGGSNLSSFPRARPFVHVVVINCLPFQAYLFPTINVFFGGRDRPVACAFEEKREGENRLRSVVVFVGRSPLFISSFLRVELKIVN